jgi:hypothetical protein
MELGRCSLGLQKSTPASIEAISRSIIVNTICLSPFTGFEI